MGHTIASSYESFSNNSFLDISCFLLSCYKVVFPNAYFDNIAFSLTAPKKLDLIFINLKLLKNLVVLIDKIIVDIEEDLFFADLMFKHLLPGLKVVPIFNLRFISFPVGSC